ncbi:MAG: molybdopterin synthase catalytic subunit MoaE [Proteobacteria bacterium]|nr:molybdopterin synthase catalytic subunit MoaE [Pseudomonadota bacterium]HQR03405.1 molybdopterin synthase catalytic subunit MoaE [Rhodocyclaceae bacterium]
MSISVQEADFDTGAEIDTLGAGGAIGAVVSFVGLMRDMRGDTAIRAMTLEHYPGMTEKALASIERQARSRWDVQRVRIIHRIGRLMPEDRIVLVAVASKHRGEAFAACQFIMDYLKTDAPFWKKEETAEGGHWVEARSSDDDARRRWNDEAKPNG